MHLVVQSVNYKIYIISGECICRFINDQMSRILTGILPFMLPTVRELGISHAFRADIW